MSVTANVLLHKLLTYFLCAKAVTAFSAS